MEKKLNTTGIVFTSVSAIIGSGWLFSPLYAAQFAGPAAILSWIIGGILVIFIAFTFAELATALPFSGGIANYPYFSHGNFASFILGWIAWLSFMALVPIEVQAAVQYASIYLPSLVSKENNQIQFTLSGYALSFVLMFLLLAINNFGVKMMSEINKWVGIWKILVPIIVIFCFLFLAPSSSSTVVDTSGFAPYGVHGVLSALAVGGVIFSFNGFQHGIMLAGEAKNPKKSIPIAVLGSVFGCMILYSFLQYAFIKAVPADAIAGGWDKVGFGGDAGPLAGLAGLLGVIWLVQLLYVDAVISPLGAGIVNCASAGRHLYGMSANSQLPAFFLKLNSFGVPSRSLFANFFVGLILFFPFPNWQSMMSFLSSAMVLTYAVGPICLASLRKQHPDLPRPFRLPFMHVMCMLAFYICNLIIFWTGWVIVSKLLFIILLGSLMFVISMIWQKKKIDLISLGWLTPYLSGLGVLSYLGTYGEGMRIIPLGWDFVFIFVLSLFCYLLSQSFSLSPTVTQKNIDKVVLARSSQSFKN